MPLPEHSADDDKKARGDVLIIAGGTELPGAAVLAGTAALRAGAGRLQIATCARNATGVGIAVPEALVIGLPETAAGGISPSAMERLAPLLKNVAAVLVGPGLQDEDAIAGLVSGIFQTTAPGPAFVIDAGAIKALRAARGSLAQHSGRVAITPHAGEMAGLMSMRRSDVEASPAETAHQAAVDFQGIVALKGSSTFLASPRKETVVCRQGNVGLGTAGSGDVLAGIVAGLLARGTDPFAAACWGVFLHGNAGKSLARQVAPLGFLAHEIAGEIPKLMQQLSCSTGRKSG